MSFIGRKASTEPPLSDTRHLSDLKFDERPISQNSVVETVPQPQVENLATDVVMLQKADVWMSQFKTRLNVGIIALVVLWAGVSYYKSTEIHLEARTLPDSETLVADEAAREDLVDAAAADDLKSEEASQVVRTEATVPTPVPEVAKPVLVEKPRVVPALAKKAAAKPVKKALVQKAKGKNSGGKTQARQQKKMKMKKSLAAKPAN